MACHRINFFCRTALVVFLCMAALFKARAVVYDFTLSPTSATITGSNSAYFSTIGAGNNSNVPGTDIPYGSSGTGIFESIVRIQNTPTEQGYNASNDNFDVKANQYTKDVRMSTVPVSNNASLGDHYKFFLDMHENDDLISLDAVQVFVTTTPSQIVSTFDANGVLQLANSRLVYNLDAPASGRTAAVDNSIDLKGFGTGSGNEDLAMFIKKSFFDAALASLGVSATQAYLVIYSHFGANATTQKIGLSSDSTFEEWDTLALVPETSGVWPLAFLAGVTGVVLYRRHRSNLAAA